MLLKHLFTLLINPYVIHLNFVDLGFRIFFGSTYWWPCFLILIIWVTWRLVVPLGTLLSLGLLPLDGFNLQRRLLFYSNSLSFKRLILHISLLSFNLMFHHNWTIIIIVRIISNTLVKLLSSGIGMSRGIFIFCVRLFFRNLRITLVSWIIFNAGNAGQKCVIIIILIKLRIISLLLFQLSIGNEWGWRKYLFMV